MNVEGADAGQLLAMLKKVTKTSELFQRKNAEQEKVNDRLRLENVVSEMISWWINYNYVKLAIKTQGQESVFVVYRPFISSVACTVGDFGG